MGLNNLVGGRGFSMGKFKNDFRSVSSYGNLKRMKDPILKLVKEKEAAIKFGNFKTTTALRHLQKDLPEGQKLSYEAKKEITKVFKRLEEKPNTTIEKTSRQAVVDRALKTDAKAVPSLAHDRPEKKEINVRINRAEQENPADIKDSRIAAAQARLNSSSATGLAGSTPTPPPGIKPQEAPAPTHKERISLN
jgi:hypothetical protein